jgi:hypothetical protein
MSEGHHLPVDLKRLALVGVVLPASIVLIDMWIWPFLGRVGNFGARAFFVSLVVKTALLSWASGRFLSFTVYGWIIFFWSQALLGVSMYATSHGAHGYELEALSHTLISAQIGFLTVWSILGQGSLAMRLTSLLAALAVIVLQHQSLDTNWYDRDLPAMQWLSAAGVASICIAVRLSGFRVVRPEIGSARIAPERFQFGIRHMLIWTTVIGLLLTFLRGIDISLLRMIHLADAAPIGAICLSISLVSLAAIWLTVGSGRPSVRILTTAGLVGAAGWMLVQLGVAWTPPQNNWNWRTDRYFELVAEFGSLWWAWLGMIAALLAAMLLFLRVTGHRLEKRRCDSATQ